MQKEHRYDRKNLAFFVKKNFGKLDLLVNNAGVAPRERKDILEITPEDFERSRRAVYSRSVQDWNSTTEIAENFMDFAFSGTDMLSYPDTVAGVTFEDINERIALSYNPSRLVLSVVKRPKEEKR